MTTAHNIHSETKIVPKKRIPCGKNKSPAVRKKSILRNRLLTAPLTASHKSSSSSSPATMNVPQSALIEKIENISLCGSCSPSSSSSSVKPTVSRSLLAKQQRLLILYHASHCDSTESCPCSVTKHCASMKALWKHMSTCNDRECKVKHCYSSRVILSHFKKCNDDFCRICTPVKAVLSNRKINRVRKSATKKTDSDIISNSATHTSTQPRRVSFTYSEECSSAEHYTTATASTVERDVNAVVKSTSICSIGANQQTSSTREPRRVSFSEMNQIHLFRS